ncbi:helix-turn-helix domain-containing protein [Streptomyces griseoflavus]|uniref:helix-turn-helix domain-containing protein n=1 Tax=Streptomyces griseoflavus TaxID=35619 RepID=UPI003D731BA5
MGDIALLTVAEAADIMRVSKMTVYNLIHSGHLQTIRIGRSLRVLETSVLSYLGEMAQVDWT